jgi:uncharacterized UBP type Zn finger protein
MSTCRHIEALYDAALPQPSPGCVECLAIGGTWVHLRRCQSCGHIGCCSQSVGRHSQAHFRETGHPVMRSHEGREQWAWCYADSIEYEPAEDWDREGAELA